MSETINVPTVKTPRQFKSFKKRLAGVVAGMIAVRDENKNLDDVADRCVKLKSNAIKTPREQFLVNVDEVIEISPRQFPDPNTFPKLKELQDNLRKVFPESEYPRPKNSTQQNSQAAAKEAKLNAELDQLMSMV